MYFYQRIRDLREDADQSQGDIAALLEISQQHYSMYETGKREPSLALLVRMSEYFNVSIHYLVTGEEFEQK